MFKCHKIHPSIERKINILKLFYMGIRIIKKLIYLIMANISEHKAEDAVLHDII